MKNNLEVIGSYHCRFQNKASIFLYIFILRAMQDHRFVPELATLEPSKSTIFISPSHAWLLGNTRWKTKERGRPHQKSYQSKFIWGKISLFSWLKEFGLAFHMTQIHQIITRFLFLFMSFWSGLWILGVPTVQGINWKFPLTLLNPYTMQFMACCRTPAVQHQEICSGDQHRSPDHVKGERF